ncbi:MAG: DNA repair protein RecO, partial [Myxococcaceae bacterium]
MERYADDAFVLSTVDYGESDRMVTLLTREHGKLTAFAA